MAYYSQSHRESTIEQFLTGAVRLLEQAKANYAHHRVYRSSLTELNTLSDRELNDLGFNRSMLKSIALKAADDYMAR